jgi:hypothetical protein
MRNQPTTYYKTIQMYDNMIVKCSKLILYNLLQPTTNRYFVVTCSK